MFEVLTAIAGFAGLLSLLIKEYTTDKNLDSKHVLGRKKEMSASGTVPIANEMLTDEVKFND